MRTLIVAGALALSLAACKSGDTSSGYPATGAPPNAPGQRTTPSHEGDKASGMARQTAVGTPGGPTDDLGGRSDAGSGAAGDAGAADAGVK